MHEPNFTHAFSALDDDLRRARLTPPATPPWVQGRLRQRRRMVVGAAATAAVVTTGIAFSGMTAGAGGAPSVLSAGAARAVLSDPTDKSGTAADPNNCSGNSPEPTSIATPNAPSSPQCGRRS